VLRSGRHYHDGNSCLREKTKGEDLEAHTTEADTGRDLAMPETGENYNKTRNVAGNPPVHQCLYSYHLGGRHSDDEGTGSYGRVPTRNCQRHRDSKHEVKKWESHLKAPGECDSGEAVSFKTKFCNFMRFGSNEDLLSETMEIGERGRRMM